MEHILVLTFAVTECVSISVFASLIGILEGITSSLATIKICTITAGIKKYKSILQEKEEKLIKEGS